jgi:hypothetical protein
MGMPCLMNEVLFFIFMSIMQCIHFVLWQQTDTDNTTSSWHHHALLESLRVELGRLPKMAGSFLFSAQQVSWKWGHSIQRWNAYWNRLKDHSKVLQDLKRSLEASSIIILCPRNRQHQATSNNQQHYLDMVQVLALDLGSSITLCYYGQLCISLAWVPLPLSNIEWLEQPWPVLVCACPSPQKQSLCRAISIFY